VKKSGYDKKTALSNYYPSLSMSSSLSNSADQWESPSKGWSAGLSLSYPLFSGGNDYYNLKVKGRDVIIAKERFKEVKNSLIKQMQSTFNEYLNAVENIAIKEKYLEASNEQSQVTTAKYINGLTTYYDWYSVENSYISAHRSYISSIKDAVIAQASWQNLLGKE
jgi:outer membrane protein TolC